MILVIVIAALALWGLVATVVEVRRDGYRAAATDWSRVTPERRAATLEP